MSWVRSQTTPVRPEKLASAPRKKVNLAALPLWSQYVIALVVTGAVTFLAWRIGHSRPTPAWLGVLQPVWMILGPVLIVFFVVRWLVRRLLGR